MQMQLKLTFCFDADSQTVFDTPPGNDPVALNLNSMGKGEAWVNGISIGRYWVSLKTPKGNPSQAWYVSTDSVNMCRVYAITCEI